MSAASRMNSLNTCSRTICGASLALLCLFARAEIYIISHPGLHITADQIKDIYTGEKQFAGTIRLTPIDNGISQNAFLAAALGLDVMKYNAIWIRRSFREGQSPPQVKPGDAAVISYVRRAPGAVGYVTTQPSGVNIVYKF